jgi:peroxiredoxin/uncharacterized membrane protein YphA (DoxX/SURF4 family)
MEYALLGARLLLAAVFIVAGIGKLLDLKGAKAAMEGFGVPANLSRPAAILLPVAELAIALFLIPTSTAWYAAIAALALLGVFIAAIAYNMSRGRHPDCHCFGQIHSEPAGWSTLIRNSVLSAVALFIVLYGTDRWSFSHGDAGESAVDWISDLSTWETVVSIVGIGALLVLAGLVWLVVHLLGQNGRVLLRLDALEAAMEKGAAQGIAAAQPAPAPAAPVAGLPVGSQAPAFKLEGMYGETMTLDALRAQGKPVMLLFTDPGCGPCNALLPDVARWQRDHAGKLTIALISSGTADANRNKAAEHGIAQVLLQNQREISNQYKAHGTPSAVILSADGVIDSPVAAGSEAIRQLIAARTGTPAAARPAQPRPAPQAPEAPAPAQPVQAQAPAPAPAPQAPAPQPAPRAQGGNGAPAAAQAPAGSGQPAPEVVLPDLAGNTVSLRDFKGAPTMLLFWNPGCGFCRKMTDELKEWETNPPKGAPRLMVVSTGTVEANQALGLTSTVVLDEGFKTGRAFGASGTPSSILIDAKGRIASAVSVGGPAVMAMARGEKAPPPQAAAPQQPASRKGQKAPEVALKDLDGNQFTLAGQQGKKTMLLFWNPGCGFCKRMKDDLNSWIGDRPATAPEVVLVSTGTPEANRDMGITATTLLDEGFSTGRKFGAGGTPSAVLIDEAGTIASDVAVGAQAVLALAGAPQPATN